MKQLPILRSLITFTFILMTSASFAEPIKMGYSDNFLPICGGKGDKVKGMLIDIMDEAFKRIGHKVEHYGFPVKRMQDFVQKGELHAFVSTPTPARAEYTIPGKEQIIKRYYHIFTLKGSPLLGKLKDATKLEELKPFLRLDFDGNGWTKKNMQEGYNIKFVTRRYQTFKMLAAGRAGSEGYILANPDVVRAQLKQLGLTDKFDSSQSKIPILNFGWNFSVSKNAPQHHHLIPKVDKVVAEMKADGTWKKIVNEWYAKETY